ncbi:hypothetical protein [Flavobacterium taihuense]|uniref:Uncharacterized protein n=1 Tax=Flavobacterium taihuense TaxID=2857508 RepID=A0ABS6Y069_9FLAO|nr:hypothetical protein [Flavobacterium taihuense]MBW4362316.1 hypothetical protein [Flavobacterium taihuense]
MKTYTRTELAKSIYTIINDKYSDPEYFYGKLKAIIKTKVKSATKTILSAEEEKEKGLGFAKWIIADFHMITIQRIEPRLSNAIIKEASDGIEIEKYEAYCKLAAKEIISEFTKVKYKAKKEEMKKRNGKRK